MGISEAEAFSERFKRELQALEPANVHAMYRIEGGIPPLLELLEFSDTKVQRAATGALRTLEFKVDENKNQIVECNALPTLILMLRYIHYEAVGVIKNLVHSCFIANEIGEGANQGEYDASVV